MDMCKKYEIDENDISDNTQVHGDDNLRSKIKPDVELRVLANIERMNPVCINFCLRKELTSLNLIMQFCKRHEQTGYLLSRKLGSRAGYELFKIYRKYEFDYKNDFDYENSEKRLNQGWGSLAVSRLEQFFKQLNIDRLVYNNLMQELNDFEEIPLFYILDKLINNEMIFENELKTTVFKRTLNCYLETSLTTQTEISKQLGMSTAGIRDIREKLVNKLRYYFPVTTLPGFLDVFDHYLEDHTQPVVLISNEDARKINDKEGTYFSSLFIAYILSYLYSDRYRKFGGAYQIFLNKGEKKVKHFYLIGRNIMRHFDFEKFFTYLESKLRVKSSSVISYDDIIRNYQKFHFEDKQAVIDVIRFIAVNEFDKEIQIGSEELILYGEIT